MIYNVIPINYAGGMGGQFLSSFLYDATNDATSNWIFSKDGNAHECDKDFSGSPPYSLSEDVSGKLNAHHLVEYAKTIPENTVVYPHGHYADPDLLMKYVDKQIKIYAEPGQSEEIVGIFMLKVPSISITFQDLTNPVEQEKYKNHRARKWRSYAENKFKRLYNSCPDLEPRMLNVSWNDMLYNDPEILISKLHQFTGIPKENFNRDKFAEWRMLTHNTVNRLKEAGLV